MLHARAVAVQQFAHRRARETSAAAEPSGGYNWAASAAAAAPPVSFLTATGAAASPFAKRSQNDDDVFVRTNLLTHLVMVVIPLL